MESVGNTNTDRSISDGYREYVNYRNNTPAVSGARYFLHSAVCNTY